MGGKYTYLYCKEVTREGKSSFFSRLEGLYYLRVSLHFFQVTWTKHQRDKDFLKTNNVRSVYTKDRKELPTINVTANKVAQTNIFRFYLSIR